MKFRPLRTASEEAEELKVCSREISSLDERHLAVGPRDSVEPRIKEEPRGTDEVIKMGETRRTDELVHGDSQQRRTDELRQQDLSAGSPTDLVSPWITPNMAYSSSLYRLAPGRWYCVEPDCRDWRGNLSKSYASESGLKRHKSENHGLRPAQYCCNIDGCDWERRSIGLTESGFPRHLLQSHGMEIQDTDAWRWEYIDSGSNPAGSKVQESKFVRD